MLAVQWNQTNRKWALTNTDFTLAANGKESKKSDESKVDEAIVRIESSLTASLNSRYQFAQREFERDKEMQEKKLQLLSSITQNLGNFGTKNKMEQILPHKVISNSTIELTNPFSE